MGDSDGTNDVTPLTVSAYFDKTHREYLKLINGEEETRSKTTQEKIKQLVKNLEDLTRQVSVLGILSENENYKELNPSQLKFILLPFMLGNLWQLSMEEGRSHVCKISRVYFKDYLRRCHNYEIIGKLPQEAVDNEEDDEEGAAVSEKAKKSVVKLSSDELRQLKVKRFKEGKALDQLISRHLNSHLNEEELDDEDLRTFIVSLLKRCTLESEDQLRSIAEELQLLSFGEKMRLAGGTSAGPSTTPHTHHHHHHGPNPSKKKPNIFILTKTEVEKEVFGQGYPAIPVMTVEELYEQRRKTGQWGHHPGSSANLPPVGETDDDRDADREALEEQDDEDLIAQQRQMDEYKDEHRRGWGNRYNRS